MATELMELVESQINAQVEGIMGLITNLLEQREYLLLPGHKIYPKHMCGISGNLPECKRRRLAHRATGYLFST